MLEALIALVFLVVGLAKWLGAALNFFFGDQAVVLEDLFCLLLGGQMIKFAYAICDSNAAAKNFEAIMDALEKIKNKL